MADGSPSMGRVGLRRCSLPSFSDRLALGRGLRVSPICVGMVTDPRAIPAAFDAGANFFFVSGDMHWPLYDATRRGLAMLFERSPSVRDEVVVAVVSYMARMEFAYGPLIEVLECVPGLERIDVVVAGGLYRDDALGRLAGYRDLVATGTLPAPRAIAASLHERAIADMLANGSISDLTFVRYNPSHAGAESDLFPKLRADRSGLVYSFKSTHDWVDESRCRAIGLAADDWRPKITDYYRYVLTRAELDGVLCSPCTPAEVEGLVNALHEGPLDDDELTYLRDLAKLTSGAARLAR